MARHSGRFGEVYIDGNKVTTVKSFKVSLKRKRTDVTCMGDANEQTVQGLPAVSGSYTGVWDDADTSLFTAQKATVSVMLYLYPDKTATATAYLYGPAWVDAEIDAKVDGAVEVSGDFSAAGDWGNTLGA